MSIGTALPKCCRFAVMVIALYFAQSCSKHSGGDDDNNGGTTNKKIDVQTIEVDKIASRFARINWAALEQDGASTTKFENGVCYGTSDNPTINDSHVSQTTIQGFYDTTLSGLSINTKYYIRAYAKYNNAVTYGKTLTFMTLGIAQLESVTIGTQVWAKKNLNVTVFRNGEDILVFPAGTVWGQLNSAGACYWQNSTSYRDIYGMLYNYYAVSDPRGLAPEGWHIPTDAEWKTLIDYLGGASVAGGKLKEAGLDHWLTPNTGATNSSGFSALPGSSRSYDPDGNYPYTIGAFGVWWSADNIAGSKASYYSLSNDNASIFNNTAFYQLGASVRLIKD